ncbi:MAG: STAS domain-containing protein [Acidihalobacter sp.]|jgi:anti-sigma B factor antagonist|uniref:STAS domain-containing protein n=1 Tax=Acidihalobacter sp. TaxID=1872108 RepID=UPI00307E2FF1
MDIQTQSTPEQGSVVLAGELDIHGVAEANETLRRVLNEAERVEVDLHDVEAIDGAGLQMLMAIKFETVRLNRELLLRRHSAAVIEAIELVQLNAFFGDPVVLRAEVSKI